MKRFGADHWSELNLIEYLSTFDSAQFGSDGIEVLRHKLLYPPSLLPIKVLVKKRKQ